MNGCAAFLFFWVLTHCCPFHLLFSCLPARPTHATTSFVTVYTLLCLLALAAGATATRATPQCIGQHGHPVSWWAALTLPHGLDYLYADSDGAAFDSIHTGLDTGPLLAGTLAPVYDRTPFALWNDAPPSAAASSAGAHAKGVLALQAETGRGFWLAHSVPHWPPVDAFAGPLPPQRVHSQHFFCLSLRNETATILTSLLATAVAPRVYAAVVPRTAAAAFPGLAPLAGLAPWPPPPPTGATCVRHNRRSAGRRLDCHCCHGRRHARGVDLA